MKTSDEKCEMGIEVIELFEQKQFMPDEVIAVLVSVLSGFAASYVDDLSGFWARVGSEGLNLSKQMVEEKLP